MRKTMCDVVIKNVDLGEIEAVFSRFDVIDLDGDVTRKGAFTDGAPVVISAYGHRSWQGELPIGKGTIHELDDVAVLRGRFFLNTTHGRDAFETIKELADGDDLQEWSYSLHDVVAKSDTVDGRKVRVIEKVRVKEVSPVLIGAGIDTGTLAVKTVKQLASATRAALSAAAKERWGDDDTWVWVDDYDPVEGFVIVTVETDDSVKLIQVDYTTDDGEVVLDAAETEVVRTVAYARKGKFSEHAGQVLASVDALTARASEVVALRAGKGKQLSTESFSVLGSLAASLERLKALIEAPPEDPADVTETSADELDELANEYARFLSLTQGVTS